MWSCRVLFKRDIINRLNNMTDGEVKAALSIVSAMSRHKLNQFELDKLRKDFMTSTRYDSKFTDALVRLSMIIVSVKYNINYIKKYNCYTLKDMAPQNILNTLVHCNIKPDNKTMEIVFTSHREYEFRVKVM